MPGIHCYRPLCFSKAFHFCYDVMLLCCYVFTSAPRSTKARHCSLRFTDEDKGVLKGPSLLASDKCKEGTSSQETTTQERPLISVKIMASLLPSLRAMSICRCESVYICTYVFRSTFIIITSRRCVCTITIIYDFCDPHLCTSTSF